MSITKNAIIRYHVLDRCFSNPGRRYRIQDLLKECNNALMELEPNSEGIKKRQLYDDIRFMQSEQGWSVELKKEKSGREVFYCYVDSKFSIKNQSINEMEANHLKSAISVLNRFKGLPQFKWIEELIPKLDQSFNLSNNPNQIMSFDENQYLQGVEHLSSLFNAILYKKVIMVTYKSFRSPESLDLLLHPYHLKQYNKRWFLIGKNSGFENLTILALDRILEIKESYDEYLPNKSVDFDEYFEDIIGVTITDNESLLKIELLADNAIAPYIKTKPLHGSQKKLGDDEYGFRFTIEVIPNKELESVILSFGEGIEVLNPESFKLKIKERLMKNLNNYD
jgi:predicted DNA-binding transcriptional regulator YafY